MPRVDSGWELASTPAGAYDRPPVCEDAEWFPTAVPGTVAGGLAALGRPEPVGESRIDERDWWFRTSLETAPPAAGEEVVLRLGGIATVWVAYLNGERVAEGDSMFAARDVDVTALLRGGDELALCCRALAPRLEGRRKPRARWRTHVAAGNLRFVRTTLHGRAPGFAPGPPPIGPWRPVTLERRAGTVVSGLRLLPHVEAGDGVLEVEARLRWLDGSGPAAVTATLAGPSGAHRIALAVEPRGDAKAVARGELRVPDVALWWPHTHGDQPLHDVGLEVDGDVLANRRMGFRSLEPSAGGDHDVDVDGLDLSINGVGLFARGAVWTPVDSLGLAPSESQLRAAIEQVRDAGMNMIRLPGTGVYESDTFHDLCDELGMLVWQDFMFANFDYPVEDDDFRVAVEQEARQELERIAGRPSLAVLCGNSEVEQQVAMFGLDPALGRGSLFGELLPQLVTESGADAPYVPSSPCGGALPFRPASGVANYFGVGGYRRPLSDARLAEVHFASECLAFANLGDGSAPGEGWTPRDVGSAWDFQDVRDHYLELLHGLDPDALRQSEPERYAALSRAVPGEVMAEVMGEWRRSASPCHGALVLCLRDVVAGAGWGVVDSAGVPKEVYHHLRRALAPVACWTTDEGLGGIAVHVANDRGYSLQALLRVSLYKDGEQLVDEAVTELELAPHGDWTGDVEGLLGHFRDVAWAYRFGAPAQDAVVVTLLGADGDRLVSQSVRFPTGRPKGCQPAHELGLEMELRTATEGAPQLSLSSRRLVYGVRLHVPGFLPDDDAFCLEPGRERVVALRPVGTGAADPGTATVTALNLAGSVPIEAAGAQP